MPDKLIPQHKSVVFSKGLFDFAKLGGGLNFVKNFHGINITDYDKEDYNCFLKVMKLKARGCSLTHISKVVQRPKSTIEKWVFNQSLPPIIRLLIEYKKLGPCNAVKWLSINSTRGGIFTGPWIKVPDNVKNYNDILSVLRQAKPLYETYEKLGNFEFANEKLDILRPNFFAYLLGILIGDSSKDEIKRERRTTRRISITLSKAYESNKRLGNFASLCANSIGLRMGRIKDMPKGKCNTNPFYRWNSQSSPLVQWIFSACLGLKDDENTTYNPIKADWLLTVPNDFKIWFIQGLADSDGFVDLSALQVGIITHPNTNLIKFMFDSLNIPSTRKLFTVNNMFSLMLKIKDADRLPVFNPYVNSYRYTLMKKICTSKRCSGHWPPWLIDRIYYYADLGMSGTQIVEKIIDEERIAVTAQKVNRRIRAR